MKDFILENDRVRLEPITQISDCEKVVNIIFKIVFRTTVPDPQIEEKQIDPVTLRSKDPFFAPLIREPYKG